MEMQLNSTSLQGTMGDKPLDIRSVKPNTPLLPGFSMAETKSSLVGLLGPRPVPL